jgi:hypothetical protein
MNIGLWFLSSFLVTTVEVTIMSNEKQFSQGFTPNLPLWSFQLQKDSKLALKTRKDLEIHLITRALKDESFRAELIANPKAVIEQEIGSKLPDELKITVLEETEDTIYMVLPCNPYEGLSEEELKASLGMTYEDVAQWVLEQQRNAFLDEESSITLIARAWRDETFKQNLLTNPASLIEQEVNDVKVPSELSIQVVAETVNRVQITLPYILDENQVLENKLMSGWAIPIAIAIGCGSREISDTESLLGSCWTCTC